MLGKKFRTLAAISISCCLFASQSVIAAEDVTKPGTYTISQYQAADSKTETAAAEQITTENKNNIKAKISLEEAKKIVKALKFTEGYEISNVFLESDGSIGQPIYRIDLFGSNDNSNMNVSISANSGELINYNLWQVYSNRKNVVAITKKQAQEAADKFIKDYININDKILELIPDTFNMYYEKMNGIYDMPQYNFTYALKVNGILVSNYNYNISVNAANGKITNFYSPYPYIVETNYPSTDGLKDLGTLKNKYSESLQMQLQYVSSYDGNTQKQYLAYIPVMPGILDAKTLEISSELNYGGYTQKLKNNPLVADFKVIDQKISDDEAQKTAENIRSYIEKLVGIKFNDNSNRIVQLSSSSKETIRSYYYSANDKRNYGLSIMINLATGNIVNFSFYQYETNNQNQQTKVNEKVNYDEAKKTSDAIIKNIFPKQYGAYSDNNKEYQDMLKNIKDQPTHQLIYPRFENDIMTYDSINVNIDKETGKPSQIYLSWSDTEYPKPQHVITADQAKELYLKNSEFELTYYIPYEYKEGTPAKSGNTLIVYRPTSISSSRYIDAEKGIIVDYNGKAIQQRYSNEAHWAAVNIEMLESQGIVLNNIKNYDDKLTRQDAVKMLSLVVGLQYYNYNEKTKGNFPDVPYDNEYFKYIESAVANKIIEATGKKFNGQQNITKQEFINMLINVLGYQDIIKHPELFVKKDSDTRIALCMALDILPVKPGKSFNAQDEITFAEAAYSLQKSLKYFR